MEGIITGIGDKQLGKNLIKPEYDAVINDFIIGKNTILEGLELNGNNLSAGTCILCGYRGIIEESKELDTTAYVYGEFILNFDTEIEDSFNIVTSTSAITTNVNPTEITSAGTYYLLLYVNGVGQIDREHKYPLSSQYSAETDYVGDNAVISPTATTPTDINELGEVITDLHLSQPNRVANTEYVHAQIEKEIDYESINIPIELKNANGVVDVSGNLILERKAKYVIAKGGIGTRSTYAFEKDTYICNIPKGFRPAKETFGLFVLKDTKNDYVLGVKIATNGNVTVFVYVMTLNKTSSSDGSVSIGYQCQ